MGKGNRNRLSKAEKARKAMKAFIESEEREQTPEEKRENAWFPVHIKSVIQDKENICYNNGYKTGEGIVKVFGFVLDEARAFAEGLQKFHTGLIDAIAKMEAEAPKPEEAPEEGKTEEK